jgi:Heterokaryon incompatibility protein (HET)
MLQNSLVPFQHAEEIARMLGFENVWIDALCIIHDLHSSCTKEASKMAAIYYQSAVTVVASSSPASSVGDATTLMEETRIQRVWSRELKMGAENGRKATVFFRKDARFDWDIPSAIDKSALVNRAWACQERMFASRILYYTDISLIWECGAGFRCREK